MIDEWEHSSKVLIYHFRYILRGMTPFDGSITGRLERLKDDAGLDNLAFAFLRRAADLISTNRKYKAKASILLLRETPCGSHSAEAARRMPGRARSIIPMLPQRLPVSGVSVEPIR